TLKATMNAKEGELTDEEKKSLLKLLENVNFSFSKDSPWKVGVTTNADITVSESFNGQVEIPFSAIEHVPIFPGCEDLTSNDEKRICVSNKITQFVGTNFNTKIAKENGITGTQRITVLFKIDTEGNIV